MLWYQLIVNFIGMYGTTHTGALASMACTLSQRLHLLLLARLRIASIILVGALLFHAD